MLLLLPLVVGAQNSPFSSGTYFVTSLPINGVVGFDTTLVADTTVTTSLHIVGVNKSCFRVSVEDYNFVYEGSVEQDSVVVVTLPTSQGLPVMEQVYKRSAVISATQPISVILAGNIGLGVSDTAGTIPNPIDYAAPRSLTEATCVQPSNRGSNEVLIMGGNGDMSFGYGDYLSVTSIVSTQDSNLISFKLSGSTYLDTWYATQVIASIEKDSVVVLRLDSLEEFSFLNVYYFIQGSSIKSLNGKGFKSLHIGRDGIRSWSNSASISFILGQVYEELRSSKWADTSFYSTPLTGHYGNTYGILALSSNTEVYMNGSYALTLDSLEHIDTTVVGPMVLESSKPVSVYLSSSTHFTLNDNSFSPFTITLPNRRETITRSTFATLNEPDTTNHYMVGVICSTSDLNSMTLDGVSVASDFLPFASDSTWSWATIEVEKGVHRLENPGGFTGYQYTWHKMDTLSFFEGSRLYPAYGYTLPQDVLWTPDSTANRVQTPKSTEHDFGYKVDTVCVGDTVRARIFGSHFSHIIMDFGDGDEETISTRNQQSVVAAHAYSQSGTYWIKVSDSIHCRTPDSTQVVVVDLPEAQFEVAVSDLCSPTITLTPTSPGIDSWEWQVRGDLTLNSTDQNLEIQLTESVQTLEVRLTVNNEWCSASETKFLDSLTHMVNLIVPNVITPNNDGVNDCLFIQNADLYGDCYSLTVYNRWGRKVLYSTDPSQCWEPSSFASGVYYYTLTYGLNTSNGAVTVLK